MIEQTSWELNIGARPVGGDRTHFRVWAPFATTVTVRLTGRQPRTVALAPQTYGYFEATVPNVKPGDRYVYVLDGKKERPDPASRHQPEGVHAPSAVVDPEAFRWTDQGWRGLPLKDLILYELHPGTFTKEGTFEAILPWLDYLKEEVGVTAIELMPVGQFPGSRNWGYDGVYLYAPQSSYGGPDGLKRLVDACHAKGLAVFLDVVYNHLGPEGNYLGEFGPYFTDRYRTPWGSAVNYDGPDSDPVRQFIISNAVYWVTEYHLDGLRLDAIHGIFDFGARHLLRELGEAVHAQAQRLGRTILVTPESDLNDARVIAPVSLGGHGLDAQWNDDFHHALRAVLTEERKGYYQDFGRVEHLAAAIQDGFTYAGQWSAYRRRRHGNSSKERAPAQFIVFDQNHDQVGNRAFGDRLSTLVSFEALKVAAATVVLSPNVPMLFMGEEYGETAPFQYFIHHGDPDLVEAVRNGRRAEFAHFGWQEELPDPQDPATFERARLHLDSRGQGAQAALLRWWRTLISLRKTLPVLGAADSSAYGHRVWSFETERVLILHRWHAHGGAALILLSFNSATARVRLHGPVGQWTRRVDASAVEFGGTGTSGLPEAVAISEQGTSLNLPPHGVAVYLRVH